MSILINPGSGPVRGSGAGWVNDYAGAEANARRWHQRIAEDGIRDVEQFVRPGFDVVKTVRAVAGNGDA